jgi:hypothetical protein
MIRTIATFTPTTQVFTALLEGGEVQQKIFLKDKVGVTAKNAISSNNSWAFKMRVKRNWPTHAKISPIYTRTR